MNVNTIPRRARLDQNSAAELAIRAAMYEVEQAGASEFLTSAVRLMGQALDCVAHHVDTVYPPAEARLKVGRTKWVEMLRHFGISLVMESMLSPSEQLPARQASKLNSLSERANKMWWCMAKRREFSAMDCCNDCVPLPVDERPCLRNPRTYDDGPTDKGYDSRTFWICSKHDTSGYGLHTCLPCLHESLANQSRPIPGFESGCGYRRSYLEYDHQ